MFAMWVAQPPRVFLVGQLILLLSLPVCHAVYDHVLLSRSLFSENIETQTRSQSFESEDKEIVWKEQTMWPYVGGDFVLDCTLRMKDGTILQNRFPHHLNITCPRCSDASAVVLERYNTHSFHTKLIAKIPKLTAEDSGEYHCQWYKTHLIGSIVTHVNVSPKKGQIRVISKTLGSTPSSPERIVVPVGQGLMLFAEMNVFPEDSIYRTYHAEWQRKYSLLGNKQVEETIKEDMYALHSKKNATGWAIEKVFLTNATTEMSGIYSLNVKILDTVHTIDWVVDVVDDKLETSVRIDSLLNDTWVWFNQTYYKSPSKVILFCVVKAMPPAKVTLLHRSFPSQPWMNVDNHELTALNGTFENGLMWETTILDDLHVKCQGDRNGISNHEEKILRTSDTSINVTYMVNKTSGATSPDDIYEGDDVVFTCRMPPEMSWDVKWVTKSDAKIHVLDDHLESHSRVIYAIWRNANAGYTKYTVDISFAGMRWTIVAGISVKKITSPYIHQPEVELTKAVKYGEHTSITCPLEGSPPPDYRWFKDDVEIANMDTLSVHAYENKVLKIARVVGEDQGVYRCEAANRAGSNSHKLDFKVDGAPKRLPLFAVVPVIAVLLLISACVIVGWFRQHRRAKEHRRALEVLYEQLIRATEKTTVQLFDSKLPLDQRINQIQYDRGFEVDSSNLQLGNRIGTGQFGQVWMGWLRKPRMVADEGLSDEKLHVAVKGPLNSSNPQHHKMLADELKIMSAIGSHPNVLSLIGAVTKNMSRGEFYVIVEMCDDGNLKDFLRKNKSRFVNELRPAASQQDPSDGYLQPNKLKYASEESDSWSSEIEQDRLLSSHDHSTLATSDLLSFATQVANGMNYLASVPCIHRDLAARNVLITSNRVVRVADFGMARSDNKNYYKLRKSRDVALPVRWMSIEAIEDGLYTQESDVWSFGILLYEMFTLGRNPYPTLANEDLLVKIKEGHRNVRPEYCHDDVYQLMQQCWDENPSRRPTFAQCLVYLREHLQIASPQLSLRLESVLRAECDKQETYSTWTNGSNEQTPSERYS